MVAPRTEAGRRLLAKLEQYLVGDFEVGPPDATDVRAIEDEAGRCPSGFIANMTSSSPVDGQYGGHARRDGHICNPNRPCEEPA